MEELIHKHFQRWAKSDVIPKHFDPEIKPYLETRAFVVADKELTQSKVSINSIKKMKKIETVEDYKHQLIGRISDWIFNKRLSNMIKKRYC